MLLHILDEAGRRLLLRLCNGCILDLETSRVIGCVQHSAYSAKFLLARVCWSVLVDHPLDKVSRKLRLCRNLLSLLLHLHLHICDSGRSLTVDH